MQPSACKIDTSCELFVWSSALFLLPPPVAPLWISDCTASGLRNRKPLQPKLHLQHRFIAHPKESTVSSSYRLKGFSLCCSPPLTPPLCLIFWCSLPHPPPSQVSFHGLAYQSLHSLKCFNHSEAYFQLFHLNQRKGGEGHRLCVFMYSKNLCMQK